MDKFLTKCSPKSDEKLVKNVSPSTSGTFHKGKSKSKTSPIRSPYPRRKRIKVLENNSTIPSWINKENNRTTQPKKQDKKPKIESKLKPLDVAKSTKTKFERTPSFEKYGVALPSYEKILADRKKFDEYKSQVERFDSIDDQVLEAPSNDCLKEVESKFSDEILDCRHLSLEELDEYMEKYMPTVAGIMDGKIRSERHQRFHHFDPRYLRTTKDLTYSTSLVVFTQEQKDRMLDKMRVELDPEDKMTNYFFQVLLPELCLLIFKDVHNMSKRKANQYLDKRPLDI